MVDVPAALQEIFHVNPRRLKQVGIQFEASDGQHLLVQAVFLGPYPAAALQAELSAVAEPGAPPGATSSRASPRRSEAETVPVPGLSVALSPQAIQDVGGRNVVATATVTNDGDRPLGPLTATLMEPYGFGLRCGARSP